MRPVQMRTSGLALALLEPTDLLLTAPRPLRTPSALRREGDPLNR
jgi:hypothetical protein